ncbi:hypothetical protein GGTG_02078 [Gaeumannomyces tritici R3-111a-1]|uniref:Uncharacterized protein n=1 Tax=Gaeumannomyces tritici (strain R3-111a-1) TaxID=644352 RepID=J3NLD0_GAET3|nr:hypothetical protein GGTG_02078 [Gaeumannomyces tritici R3-111a-1]EJT82104.1 hypothetical protein GGTG_02078 [Gaeumannomyces tritici R3-111a-1]
MAASSDTEGAAKATSLARGAVYCWDDFKAKRLLCWYAAEVDRQLGLPENTTAAAVKKHEEMGAAAAQPEEQPGNNPAASPDPNGPPVVRVQPRRAAKRRLTVAELLAGHKPPGSKSNKKSKGEGNDYALSRWELAEASRGSQGVAEAAAVADDRAAAAAAAAAAVVARAFLARVEAAVSARAVELAAARNERMAAGAPRVRCALDEVLARQTMGCACCRADGDTRGSGGGGGGGDGPRAQATVLVLPPRRPAALMLPTPSLGRWPGIPTALAGGGEGRVGGEGKRLRGTAGEDYAPKRRRADVPVQPLRQQACDSFLGEADEDIELGRVAVGGLRFALDICKGIGGRKRILML